MGNPTSKVSGVREAMGVQSFGLWRRLRAVRQETFPGLKFFLLRDLM